MNTRRLTGNALKESFIERCRGRLTPRSGLMWLVILATVASQTAHRSAWGQTNLRPSTPAEAVLHRGGSAPYVRLDHNTAEAVAKEIDSRKLRTLFAKILNLPESTLLQSRYAMNNAFQVQVSTLRLPEPNAESLAKLLQQYVRLRTSGHTAKYSFASFEEHLRHHEPEADGFRMRLFAAFPYIPRHWVNTDPYSAATPAKTNSEVSQQFVVIDGEIAWTYVVPLGSGPVSETKVDSREFDAKLRPLFDAARQQAEEKLEKAGISKRFGYVRRFEAELDSILSQKYGIRRRGFAELNPGIIIH